jgi:hypothetical protein
MAEKNEHQLRREINDHFDALERKIIQLAELMEGYGYTFSKSQAENNVSLLNNIRRMVMNK